ncbi:MAG TPA: DUF4136 domain-containing protein [Pontiella sp.]|nr:DUF4136 domain-containing protein [Pontiella sp.]
MKSILSLAVSVLMLAGCSSVSVSRDYDASADFLNLKTFAWRHAVQPETGSPRIDNDLMDERVRRAVNAELAEKGFRLAPREEADFLVAYFVEYKQRIGGSSVSMSASRGSYGRYGGVGYNTTISEYDEGYLTIDIINPASDRNIWRGVGRRTTYEGSSPKKMTKIVNTSVSRILAKFPPQK